MARPLPNHPQLRGNYAPIHFEAEYTDLIVEGSLPEGLEGSLYRIGPNPKFVPIRGITGSSAPAWCMRFTLAAAG